ncbi:spinster family MFS transporter [Peristeroidobacter soli]|jgi:MFS family permease|uniref:spinster family MFS transporter n=1 Tax=Peristeroidobacter soli TaxID=2497877 RepID=UPI00101B8332|nr:MFS transporter [Peristeroidobacter soli]
MNTDERDQGDYPSATYSWYVVAVLTLTYTVSFVDRQIMALLIEPIRRDLQISDTQVSLLIGLAFAVFYTLLGVPIARLADRRSRRVIIAAGITIWCFMTAACGVARNYLQLFAARIGVGVGEAALSPSALSMLSDYFPKRTRGRAVAVYNTGITLGTGLAMIVGGQVVMHVANAPPVVLPVVGQLYAWQTVFIVVGLPGLLMALLMTTVKEPRRREQMVNERGDANLAFSEVVKFVGDRFRMYGSHFFGMSTVAILAYGLFAWVPSMFIRTWGWTIAEIGLAYGIVTLVAGPVAVLFVSMVSERLIARGYQDAQMRTALISILVGVAGAIATALSPSPELAVAMLLPASVGTTAATAAGLSGLMTVTPNQMRAQTSALYYLVVNLFGLTVGPTGIAMFTDYVFADTNMLRYSVASVATIAGVIAAIVLSYNLKHYRRSFAESQSWSVS